MKRQMRIDGADFRLYRNCESGFLLPGQAAAGYLLTWLEQGQLHLVADGKDVLLQPGELWICAPNQWHMQYADITESPQFISILLETTQMDLHILTGRKLTCDEPCFQLFSQVLRELDSEEPFSGDMIFVLLEMALLRLLRAHNAAPTPTPALHAENRIIHRAQQYAAAHIRDKLTVPTLAKGADVSPSYLTALFHKHLGISPGEYIRRLKLQEAKELIRAGKLNFTEIAAVLNYSNVHHFSRQFKDKFGISPTEYANSIR